jgi:hypothetical protein
MSHQSELISTDINAYLAQHERKELLRLLTCGSVDDGKSTLIGRLLYDAKMIYEDQLAAIQEDSVKSGTTGDNIDLALLLMSLIAIFQLQNENLSLLTLQGMNNTHGIWRPARPPAILQSSLLMQDTASKLRLNDIAF